MDVMQRIKVSLARRWGMLELASEVLLVHWHTKKHIILLGFKAPLISSPFLLLEFPGKKKSDKNLFRSTLSLLLFFSAGLKK